LFLQERTNNSQIKLVCAYEDQVDEFEIRLPDTFREFYQVIHSRYRHRWSDTELLIQYYDEAVHNYLNLNDKNWLEYRKNAISQWSSTPQMFHFSCQPVFRFMITEVQKSSVISSVKSTNDQFSRSYHNTATAQPSFDSLDEMSKSSILITSMNYYLRICFNLH